MRSPNRSSGLLSFEQVTVIRNKRRRYTLPNLDLDKLPDAHAADAAHVDAPGLAGLSSCRARGAASGSLSRSRFGSVYRRRLLRMTVTCSKLGHGLTRVGDLIAGAHALAGAVVDAPGQIGVDLLAVIRVDGRQARAGGRLGAFQAVFAHLRRDVHVRLAGKIAKLLDDLPFFLQDACGDA